MTRSFAAGKMKQEYWMISLCVSKYTFHATTYWPEPAFFLPELNKNMKNNNFPWYVYIISEEIIQLSSKYPFRSNFEYEEEVLFDIERKSSIRAWQIMTNISEWQIIDLVLYFEHIHTDHKRNEEKCSPPQIPYDCHMATGKKVLT